MTTDIPFALALERVTKRFGTVTAVCDVTLHVRRGEFLTLLGPSGSGKTTIQRLIGGFERPDDGHISINGQIVDWLPAYQRDTATVFQSAALFPHKTVAENIAYGLRVRRRSTGEIAERVDRTLSLVRLQGLSDRYPQQLSGGEKQRVALARAIVVEPAVLLFDEPLSALDLQLRLQLRAEIKRLHEVLGFTAVYVTHDQGEAMSLSDRIAVINRGGLEQLGRPEEIFFAPANEFVFSFVGESCSLRLSAADGRYRSPSGEELDLVLAVPRPSGEFGIHFRPRRLQLGTAGEACENRLKAKVSFVEFLGETWRVHLEAGNQQLFADLAAAQNIEAGHRVVVGWNSGDGRVYC
ncbi:MAG TPA: ABC transporter ATP-binding protein [Alphaproteobacteria bacterium]|nr:ABC transporter ATP-binding protein [Alphaproteobacteria bacterium]